MEMSGIPGYHAELSQLSGDSASRGGIEEETMYYEDIDVGDVSWGRGHLKTGFMCVGAAHYRQEGCLCWMSTTSWPSHAGASANMGLTRYSRSVPLCLKWEGSSSTRSGAWAAIRNSCMGSTHMWGLENIEAKARKWLYDPVSLGDFFSETEYANEIYGEARTILAQYWKKPSEIPSMTEWLASGRWVWGRAGTEAKTTIVIDGKVEKSRSMKGVDAALMSDEELGEELKRPIAEQFHIMEKSEGGKSRRVVKTSNESNRKIDFLSEVVEKGLYGSRFST
uniref:Uncharacterized protein n=1 Tax=Schizaphis graminum TaxID=13262 RepID=A0A2S2P0U7_SCHGA